MTVTLIVLTLLSILSSWIVLCGSVVSTLRAKRRSGQPYTGLGDWQRLQLCVCLLDAFLLVAVAPLFVIHARQSEPVVSIWHTAFKTVKTTLAMTTALVFRPTLFAALAANIYLKRKSRKRWQALLPFAAVVVAAGVSIAAAARCSSVLHGSSSCVAAPFVKLTIITAQMVLAASATTLLVMTFTTKTKAEKCTQSAHSFPRSSIVPPRAPSLSLLIHTQPDPWTRHIDLDSPIKTEFGLRRSSLQASDDYGPQLVRGILEDTAGSDRATDAAATSPGYASAVASSTNPYHTGSAFSLTSRDALNSLAESRIDLAAAGAENASRYATSTSKPSTALQHFGTASLPSRTLSPGLLDDSSRPHSRLSGTATEELLLDPRTKGSSQSEGGLFRSRRSLGKLAACVSSLWCPIALSSTALLVNASSGQTFILLASFCFPATILLAKEITLGCSKRHRLPSRTQPISQIRDSDTDAPSTRSSIASSAVVVYETPDLLRNRRPHLRSRSCPLESELNGYGDSLLGWDKHAGTAGRHRQSLSSAKSVPYLSKHWAAGKVSGDRVVAPRSSFVRGLNLMLNPKPKLEILPCPSKDQDYAARSPKTRNSSARQSLLPPEVSSAVVEGLLEAPHVRGQWTADSERTCITQCYALDATHASSSMVSLHTPEGEGERFDTMSRQMDRPRDMKAEESHDVILDMDDTPGSPRVRTDVPPINDHVALQSPTKRQDTAPCNPRSTPIRAGMLPTASPSFSCNDDSQVTSNSATRLFSEIMDMVRGNVGNNRVSDQRSGVSFNQSLRRSPPKGYASVDGVTALKEVSKYDSATEDCDTIVIHSVDSSCDFRTAASQSVTQKTIASRSHAVTVGHVHTYDGEGDQSVSRLTSTVEHEQAEVELVRKGSTSSTLSLSSISSRIRSLRRAVSVTNVTPAGSPSSRTGGEQRHVKKIRSRTFASAFGIELGILSGMKGRRDAPGSHVDSSPSTSAGTCPSSLMDLSFSPSPAAPRQTTKVFGNQQETPSPDNDVNDSMPLGAKKAHRRNLSRADSIMDMLDEEHGDTIEEMLNAVDVVSCTSREGEGCEEEAINAWNPAGKHDKSSFSEHFVADLDGEAVGFGEACEVDLADMTVHDAWERCFQRDDSMDSNDAMLAAKSEHEEVVPSARNDYDLMGFDTRRMIARAPFLDTVEEEPEEEQVAEASEEHQDGSTQERAGQDENSHQESRLDLVDAASNDVRDISSNSRWSSNIANPIDSITDGCGASRESLLLERESEQRRTTQLLMEHEVMFPHKTLSRIEEVTEVATTLRTSGYRTISAASANKLAGEKTASTADSGSIRLGLPLSLACQGGVERSGNDTPDSKSTVSVDKVEGDIREDQDEEHHLEERQLPFVTPRSRMRRRAAAGRKATIRSFGAEITTADLLRSPGDQAQVDPSPRSRSERLGQLGMDQGIWMQSPVKLHLEESGAVVAAEGDISRDTNDVSSSFQMVDASIGVGTGRSIRLGRSLTLTRSRAALESKAVTMKKLVRLDHYDSPKRELRNRLARTSESLESHATGSSPQEKRLPHKPIKKRRKSRIKGVAVMIARHQFTVVDEDDSLIQRFNAAQPRGPSDNRATKTATVPQ